MAAQMLGLRIQQLPANVAEVVRVQVVYSKQEEVTILPAVVTCKQDGLLRLSYLVGESKAEVIGISMSSI